MSQKEEVKNFRLEAQQNIEKRSREKGFGRETVGR
jgi:hypothetical protein